RAKTQCLENIRLTFGCEVDRLRVATALNVEDSVVAPDVFVVPDKMAFGIGGKRRLPRPAESKKQRRHAALLVRGSGAMHREKAARGREVVRDRKDTFLHLTGVFGAHNDKLPILETQVDAGRRAHTTR